MARRLRLLPTLLVVGVLAPVLAAAQHSGHRASPYAGFEQRAVKALSADEIADLRSGRGMGLALEAELNGYPGPVHVIELASELALSDRQLAHARELFEAMKTETVPIGERLITQESELDRLFANRTVTGESLDAALQSIGATRAALRAAHLESSRNHRDPHARAGRALFRIARLCEHTSADIAPS